MLFFRGRTFKFGERVGKLYRLNCHTVSSPRCFNTVAHVASRPSVTEVKETNKKWESKRMLCSNSSFKGDVKIKPDVGQKIAFGNFMFVNYSGYSASGSVGDMLHTGI